MNSLVVIRQIDPNTILLLSMLRKTTCLRDYSRGPLSPACKKQARSRSEIEQLLLVPGNYREDAPRHPTHDEQFWHRVVSERNHQLHLPGNEGLGQFDRLLDRFQAEVGSLIAKADSGRLKDCLWDWVAKLNVVAGRGRFNHWDDDDSTGKFPVSKGLGWTSRMLEYCRHGETMNWIKTDRPELDFSLIAMELGVKISSKSNPFRKGSSSSVRPDGLGVRRDGSFCIVEVKAISDHATLFRASAQALCGAAAVFANRGIIKEIAQKPSGRRLAVATPFIPAEAASLGLYVMIDARNYKFPVKSDLEESIRCIMDAFMPLHEIAFFQVDPESSSFPGHISVHRVLTRHTSA